MGERPVHRGLKGREEAKMARTRKIMLTITTAIMLFCTVILGIIHINLNPTSALAESPTVSCQGIANDINNNILEASTPAKCGCRRQ